MPSPRHDGCPGSSIFRGSANLGAISRCDAGWAGPGVWCRRSGTDECLVSGAGAAGTEQRRRRGQNGGGRRHPMSPWRGVQHEGAIFAVGARETGNPALQRHPGGQSPWRSRAIIRDGAAAMELNGAPVGELHIIVGRKTTCVHLPNHGCVGSGKEFHRSGWWVVFRLRFFFSELVVNLDAYKFRFGTCNCTCKLTFQSDKS